MAEYAVVLAVISVLVVTAIGLLATNVGAELTRIADYIK
jgi:Flp pilus assembly pilin Flp